MSSKRKAAASSSSTTTATTTNPKPRASKLAKENNLTAAQELEIRESFSLFAVPSTSRSASTKEGLLPTPDIRRALIALNLSPSPRELAEFISILDPDSEGVCAYAEFVAVAALKMHAKVQDEDSREREVDEAWGLFTAGGGGGEERITLQTLKRVAKALKEDVDEAVLRDMILEANGGGGVSKGVERGEFEVIMRRAGVFR